jgi:hypothetical protein
MFPSPSRVAARYRAASPFRLSAYLQKHKKSLRGTDLTDYKRWLKGLQHDLSTKIEQSFSKAVPNWQITEVRVSDIDVRWERGNREVVVWIGAEAKPKPSHPNYDWLFDNVHVPLAETRRWLTDVEEGKKGSWIIGGDGEIGRYANMQIHFSGVVL